MPGGGSEHSRHELRGVPVPCAQADPKQARVNGLGDACVGVWRDMRGI